MTAEPFAELVRDWIRRWHRDRPPPVRNQYREDDELPPIQPLAWLAAAASNVADPCGELDEPVVPKGTLERLLRRETRRIELRVADAIATALERPDVLYDDRVEVIPNPRASEQARARCCAGSDAVAV